MRLNRYLLLLLMSLLAGLWTAPAIAQEIPFQFREGLIWVEVQARCGGEPLNFLLDTGAEASVLNLDTAKRYRLKLGKSLVVQGVGAETTGHWPVRFAASAANVTLPLEFLAVDLKDFSGACSRPVDGLIGADFFRDRVVEIDFGARKLRLLSSNPPSKDQQSVALQRRHGGLLVPIYVNQDKPQWVRLDTGCASNLHWVTPTAAQSATGGSEMLVALTGLSVPLAPMNVQLGEVLFEKVQTGLHNKQLFRDEGGLLGNGLLSRFESVTIDAIAGRLLFKVPSRGLAGG